MFFHSARCASSTSRMAYRWPRSRCLAPLCCCMRPLLRERCDEQSYITLTEDQIERRVEKQMDRLDAQFLNGQLEQWQYNASGENPVAMGG